MARSAVESLERLSPVSVERLAAVTKTLASDEFGGRAPGTPGGARLQSVRRKRLHRSFVLLLDQPVAHAEFLAVDTETNGLAVDLCELTEVGAVLVGGGELHETFDSVVRT